eukprot:TRINITY_DN12318_c0_g1_i1.p1 TRINITY_DN12318_c0_g1~~TRINITY_DN12318_c0_g1_i1.p1  ORF type:complete len:434 (+),score=83.74 TRINITY_DN12318_c0_g1_i1:130-1431(+)
MIYDWDDTKLKMVDIKKSKKNRKNYSIKKIFLILIFVGISIWILFYSHVILCRFELGLCSPYVSNLLRNRISFPEKITKIDYYNDLNDSRDMFLRNKKMKYHGGSKEKYQWLLILSTQKSGSTWVSRKLNEHPELSILSNEKMKNWRRDCDQCTWQEFQKSLEGIFLMIEERYIDVNTTKIGFKIMYNQIPIEFIPHFVNWVSINNVQILHSVRGSVVESFFTFQIQLYEWIAGKKNIRIDNSENIRQSIIGEDDNTLDANLEEEELIKVLKRNGLYSESEEDSTIELNIEDLESSQYPFSSLTIDPQQHEKDQHVSSLYLDPVIVREYVDRIELFEENYEQLFRYYHKHINDPKGSKKISYFKLFYEQIAGDYSLEQWTSVLSFLGVDPNIDMEDTLKKVHSGSCGSKIINSKTIQRALEGTRSYHACSWFS